jgi:hypothetical protein
MMGDIIQGIYRNGPGGGETPRSPAHRTWRFTVDEQQSTARPAHPSTEDHDHQDHPHACLNGYVYLGYTAVDEETGEVVERVEALPCRRCAEGE